jgi:hypothetical protein
VVSQVGIRTKVILLSRNVEISDRIIPFKRLAEVCCFGRALTVTDYDQLEVFVSIAPRVAGIAGE